MGSALLFLLLAACAPASPSATTHDLTGTFTLTQTDAVRRGGSDCHGTGGYEDVQAGLEVVVRNEAGSIIASGALDYTTPSGAGGTSTRTCAFTFQLPDVPAATFYEVEVGERGTLTYSAAELEAQGWAVDFTLGP